MGRCLLGFCLVGLLGGCVERAPELSPADRERVQEYLSTSATEPENPLRVTFAEGVELTGYDLSPDRVRPGQPFTITLHWRADRAPGAGWLLFTHLESAGGGHFNADGATDNPLVEQAMVRELYPPFRWQAGQSVRDPLRIRLPESWRGDEVVVYAGIYRGDTRMEVTRGPSDGENRVRVAAIPVGDEAATRSGASGSPVRRPPPAARAERASTEITLDGELEEAWESARPTSAFVNSTNGAPVEGLTAQGRFLWDDDHLYVAVEVDDRSLRSAMTARDEHLWEEDVVEVMLQPLGERTAYYEIQVAPTGTTFETRYDDRRLPQPFGHVDWNPDVRVGVSTRGTVNDETPDEGYRVELAIPWSSLAVDGEPVGTPDGGAVWRINLFAIDRPLGDGGAVAAAWSPTYTNDFHVPHRFGRVMMAADRAAVAEVPEVPIPRVAPLGRRELNPANTPAATPRAAQELQRSYRQPGSRLAVPPAEAR